MECEYEERGRVNAPVHLRIKGKDTASELSRSKNTFSLVVDRQHMSHTANNNSAQHVRTT